MEEKSYVNCSAFKFLDSHTFKARWCIHSIDYVYCCIKLIQHVMCTNVELQYLVIACNKKSQ